MVDLDFPGQDCEHCCWLVLMDVEITLFFPWKTRALFLNFGKLSTIRKTENVSSNPLLHAPKQAARKWWINWNFIFLACIEELDLKDMFVMQDLTKGIIKLR